MQIRNQQAAQAEAERRWGRMARAWIIAGRRFVSSNPEPNAGWSRFDGQGASWDEAFANVPPKTKRLSSENNLK